MQKDLIIGRGLCGIAMFLGAYFQQLGLANTTVGKAGFIIAMYIVIILLISLFFHRKTEMMIWASIALAVVGLYFLCISENFSISRGDFYVFIGSLFWAIQTTLIDTYFRKTDSLELVLVELVVMDFLSLFCAFQMEPPNPQLLTASTGLILYTGIMVVDVAYTFQALGQKTVSPTIAGLILSTKPLFGIVSGILVFQEIMSLWEVCGCVLTFGVLMLTQTRLSVSQKLLPEAVLAASESSSTPDKQLQTPAMQNIKSE